MLTSKVLGNLRAKLNKTGNDHLMGKLKVTFFSRQNLNIHFHWQIVQQYAIQDEFTQKTQDLNPKCKEDSK